ncbi:MAG: hypothetical protein H7301_13775 [Cryobacterium sp.]|nr:hypothetical protein [Oligoflexia bacterium]
MAALPIRIFSFALYTVLALAFLTTKSACAGDIPERCEAASRFGALQIVKGNGLWAPMESGDWDEVRSEISTHCDDLPRPSYCGNNLGIIVWAAHMFPNGSAAYFAYDLQTTRIAERFYSFFQQGIEKTGVGKAGVPIRLPENHSFISLIENSPIVTQYRAEEIQWTRKRMEKLREGRHAFDADIEKVTSNALTLCRAHGPLSSAHGCMQALQKTSRRMHPSKIGVFAYSRLDLIDQLLTDPRFAQALPLLALRIHARILGNWKGSKKIRPEGAFFTDTYEAFASLGLSKVEAEDYAWKWMGIYSTRGASFSNLYELLHERQLSLGYAILGVSSGASALDQIAYPSAPYTLPRVYVSHCFYGKPYHFWMNAFFTRELIGEGFTKTASTLAAYITGVLYEFGSESMGRDPSRAMKEPLSSNYNEWLKMNLFFDAWGIRFGRDSHMLGDYSAPIQTALSLESFITSTHEWDGVPVPIETRLLKRDSTRYLLWLQKFMPYTYLREVLKADRSIWTVKNLSLHPATR